MHMTCITTCSPASSCMDVVALACICVTASLAMHVRFASRQQRWSTSASHGMLRMCRGSGNDLSGCINDAKCMQVCLPSLLLTKHSQCHQYTAKFGQLNCISRVKGSCLPSHTRWLTAFLVRRIPFTLHGSVMCTGCEYPCHVHEAEKLIMVVQYMLTKRFGFNEENITILLDDSSDPDKWPTGNNMRHHMRQLVAGAQSGDSLLFHFSGQPCCTVASPSQEKSESMPISRPHCKQRNYSALFGFDVSTGVDCCCRSAI